MPNGCTNISAVNYDPLATTWDHSCIFLVRALGACLKFTDLDEYEDKSFTMSYSVEGESWVFFHDFIPDFYFHTREQLYSAKFNKFYEHNTGEYGKYHDIDTIKPFFIDVVFKADEEITLETVNWISSVIEDRPDNSSIGNEWNTLTHISIWNSEQHTGRIALSDVFNHLQYQTSRKTKGEWTFNDFRNVVENRGTQFIGTLFEDYALDTNFVAPKSWYEKELMQDKYMIVRFEFDNSQQKQLLLHEATIQAQKTGR